MQDKLLEEILTVLRAILAAQREICDRLKAIEENQAP